MKEFLEYTEDDVFDRFKSDLQNMAETFFKKLNTPYFTRGDVQVDLRKIYHWEREGLLPILNENRQWRKYSLLECIWIRIIRELRDFNVSIDGIRKIKHKLFESNLFGIVPDWLYEKIPDYLHEIPIFNNHEMWREYKDLPDVDKMEAIKEKGINLLGIMVLATILTRKTGSMLFNSKGEFGFINFSEFFMNEKMKIAQHFFQSTFISLNLLEIINEFLKNDKLEASVCYDLDILSAAEKKIIDLIKSGDFTELKIVAPGGKIDRVERKRQVVTKDIENKVLRLFNSGEYSSVQVKSENGRIVHAEKTEKFKL